jgi:methionyl-tRNA formyltransferase
LEVRIPTRLRSNLAEQAAFAALGLDAAVVAAYGLILPEAMLTGPRLGCFNLHASLLPRWRGAAPIQAAIMAGDSETGVTIMQMDAGLDTGPMLLQERVPITTTATAATMHDVLAKLGARLILHALTDRPRPVRQPDEGVTYAPKLSRDSGRIDWTRDAPALERQVRAYNPWPGTFTTLHGKMLKVLAAEPCRRSGDPGAVLDEHLTVACGTGALRLTRVQLAGRPAMPAEDFLHGHAVTLGVFLGS